MDLYKNTVYMNDIAKVAESDIDWDFFKNKSIAISGGTGMIGSFLADVICYRNEICDQNTVVYILGRSEKKACDRFGTRLDGSRLIFCECDINSADMQKSLPKSIDYVIHAASNTHPKAYATDPIGTVTANVIGAHNLLKWAKNAGCSSFSYLSSVEIYGENRGDVDKFTEDYLGYIDCNTLRAGYPESKRVGEALCQAFIAQESMNIVIPRLSRVYGPTMLKSDTKAMSQFIMKGVKGEDIVLKSAGTQLYSYSYVADAVGAILFILAKGKCGEAYNVASDDSDVMLKDIAQVIADQAGKNVVFELPDKVESAGYSKATKALLDTTRLKALGYKPLFGMKEGLLHTLSVLSDS